MMTAAIKNSSRLIWVRTVLGYRFSFDGRYIALYRTTPVMAHLEIIAMAVNRNNDQRRL